MSSGSGVVLLRGGASFVNYRPLFSPDGRYLMCCCSQVIKVFSIASGECLHELNGHTNSVSGTTLHPRLQNRLISCSLDGLVIEWDYSDGALLKKFDLRFPLYGIHILTESANQLIITRQQGKVFYEVDIYDTEKHDAIKVFTNIPKLYIQDKCIAIGPKNEYIASVKPKKLKVYSVKKNTHKEYSNEDGKPFTCIACHPVELCIATGCTDGKIFLWYNFLHTKKKVVKTVIHWHALPVEDLVFSHEGSYLLSGGHECVLVKWQFRTHQKDFLPRLGAPINRIACSYDNSLYAICQTDNSIQVISNHFKVKQVIQGLTQGHLVHQMRNPVPVGFMIDPRTKALVTNGKPGHLQFYNCHQDRHLYNLDIVGQNYISPQNFEEPVTVTEIEKASFSSNGDWLATVEHRDDGITSVTLRLKFWKFDQETRGFVLNTSVNLPHSETVNCLKFNPLDEDNIVAVTTSEDKTFKLWSLSEDSDIYREHTCWTCDSVGYYKDYASGPADFSEDGSVLAVAFSHVLTFWDPDTNVLQKTVSCCSSPDKIRHVLFGRNKCCHLLVCSTNDSLQVWDLLKFQLLWTSDVTVTSISIDITSDTMAVFDVDRIVSVYKLSLREALYTKTDISTAPILCSIFIPHTTTSKQDNDKLLEWTITAQLYFYNANQELLTIEDEMKTRADPLRSQVVALEDSSQSVLSSILTAGSSQVVKTDTSKLIGKQGLHNESIKELLTSAPNVLPPVSTMCKRFMMSLLITNKQSQTIKEGDESDDDDERTKEANIKAEDNSDSDRDTVDTVNKQDAITSAQLHQDRTSSRNRKEELREVSKENMDWVKSK